MDYRHQALAPDWRVTALHASPQAAADEAAHVLALLGRPLAEMAVAANDDVEAGSAGRWRWWTGSWRLGALALSGVACLALAAVVWSATR